MSAKRKPRLAELDVAVENRIKRLQSIARVLKKADFAEAYEAAKPADAAEVVRMVEAGDADGLKAWLKRWQEAQKVLEELPVPKLRDLARAEGVPDSEIRNVKGKDHKLSLIPLILAYRKRNSR